MTQLSTTLVGRDGAEVAELVERLRPRKRHAERYAASVNAGTVDDQIGRFRALADAGVGTAIVSLPDLEGDTSRRTLRKGHRGVPPLVRLRSPPGEAAPSLRAGSAKRERVARNERRARSESQKW